MRDGRAGDRSLPGATRRLTWAVATLVVAQVLHVVASLPADRGATTGGRLGQPLALLGFVASLVALGGCLAGTRWASAVTGVTGAAVAIGFVLYHSIPVDVAGLNNPYFGAGSASLAQWVTVLLAIGAGALCAWWTRPATVVSDTSGGRDHHTAAAEPASR